jgi:regulator of protease activity HflC (stomatin/prohibitin superfamily)
LDIAPQDTITRDNVSVRVNAVVYFRVADPVKAVVEIEDYFFATSQLAQTTLRSVIGQSELDELLAERERINEVVRTIIDQGTDPWGIQVTGVEVKDIDLPQEMKRAMAKQAEAERERRAKVINAEGEYQASAKLAAAAEIIQEFPAALQLRFLQTVVEVAAENNSTTLFPIPMDLFSPMLNAGPAPSDEAKARAVKASVETLLEVLPKDLSGVTLEAAAKAVAASPDEPEADRALPAPANVDDDEE